jgi:tetratricopeptide (TPR) repeat protein
MMILLALGAALAGGPSPTPPTREALLEGPLLRAAPRATQVFVPVGLPDGTTELFLVDTGADRSLITRELARRLGLSTHGSLEITGADAGPTRLAMATLDGLTLGGPLGPLDVGVGVGSLTVDPTLPVGGLLGNDVWSRGVLTLDYAADTLTLSPSGDARRPPRAAPLAWDGSHPRAWVTLIGEPSPQGAPRLTLPLVLDTGAHGVLLFGDAGLGWPGRWTEGAERVQGVIGASEALSPVVSRRFSLDAALIGPQRRPLHLEARWIEPAALTSPMSGVTGVIGHEAFEGGRLTLAYADGWFTLQSPDPTPRSATPWEPAPDAIARGPLAPAHDARAALLAADQAAFGDDPARAVYRARLLIGAQRGREAAALLEELLSIADPEIAPQHLVARVWLARIRRGAGDAIGARAALAPLSAADLVEQGELLPVVRGFLWDDRPAEAFELAVEAAEAAPSLSEPWLALTEVALYEGDGDTALAHLQAAAAAQDGAASTVGPHPWPLLRARVALAQGDVAGARAVLRGTYQVDPFAFDALWLHARLYAATDPTALRADLDATLARMHPSLVPLDLLAGIWAELGELDAAADAATRGIQERCATRRAPPDRDNCEAWHLAMGRVRLDDALRLIEGALRSGGVRAGYLDTLALVHRARGERDEARQASLQAARLRPSDPMLAWHADPRTER